MIKILFKTNFRNEYQKQMITPVICQIEGVKHWSIDFEDKDKILRIEGLGLNSKSIEQEIINAGFDCKILY